MKLQTNILNRWIKFSAVLASCLLLFQAVLTAQDSTSVTEETTAPVKVKPVKNTFQSVWIIDNQTVLVPNKGTLEMDIMHRFGVIDEGARDFWGFFEPSNIRLGINYAPINKLSLGIGITKEKMLFDVSAKYSLFTQTKGKYPVSLTYYGNAALDSRKNGVTDIYDGSSIKHWSDRLFFFHEIIISGYYIKNDSTGKEIYKSMKNDHFAFSISARYKLTTVTSVLFNYDQPITKHPSNNPSPNLSFGVEFNTSSHSFQLFFTNYYNLNQQRNNLFNKNSPFAYTDKVTGKKVDGRQFLIGFNITRLWSY